MGIMFWIVHVLDLECIGLYQESENFLSHLENATFIAIDQEMTGISVPSPDGKRVFMPKDDTPQERSVQQRHVYIDSRIIFLLGKLN